MCDNFPSAEVSEMQRESKDAASPTAETLHDRQQAAPVEAEIATPWELGLSGQ